MAKGKSGSKSQSKRMASMKHESMMMEKKEMSKMYKKHK